jgi:TRAP-type C4-dicarboxylate transport system permease small subunit
MASSSPSASGGPLAIIDRISDFSGQLGVIMVICVSAMLSYEAFARYLFNAPTQWTQDVSVTLQVWFTYLGMALVLKEREMIRISALLSVAPRWARYVLEGLALLIIFLFSVMAVDQGYGMVIDSFVLDRRQPTMLAMPNWIAELPVVLGFALLAVQALADLIRLPFRPAPEFSPGGEHDPAAFETPSSTEQGARS